MNREKSLQQVFASIKTQHFHFPIYYAIALFPYLNFSASFEPDKKRKTILLLNMVEELFIPFN